jgi:hypothetical protein
MRFVQRWRLVAALALACGLPRFLSAQEPAAASTTTTMRVSQSAAPPGATLVAPIYLAPAAGLSVGEITLELEFPAAVLSFEKAGRSGLSEAVDAALVTDVKKQDGKPDATLVLTLSTIGSAGTRRPLPDAPIAHVFFKVAGTAKPETVLKLAARAAGRTTDEPPKPVTITVPPAEFIVSSPGVVSCFYYMH